MILLYSYFVNQSCISCQSLSKSSVCVMGLGEEGEEVSEKSMAKLGAAVAAKCCDCNAKNVSFVIDYDLSSSSFSSFVAEFYDALHSDNRYRTRDVKTKAENLELLTIVCEKGMSDEALIEKAIKTGRAYAAGIRLTKDIVNAPHNVLNSESLAKAAKRVADESGGTITHKILGKEECEELGMGAYLGVARGSETEPRFIHLTYKPPSGVVKKRVGIVGKGLLFDTGGYNIKTAMMELMKFDCGGAVSVQML